MLAAKLVSEWERVTGRPYNRADPSQNYPYVFISRNGGPTTKRGAGLGSWIDDLDYIIDTFEGTAMGRDGDFTVMSTEDQLVMFEYCFDWSEHEQFDSLNGAINRWMKYTEEGRAWKKSHSYHITPRGAETISP